GELGDAGLPQQPLPVAGVALLGFGQAIEDVPPAALRGVGQRPVEGGRVELVLPHLLEQRQPVRFHRHVWKIYPEALSTPLPAGRGRGAGPPGRRRPGPSPAASPSPRRPGGRPRRCRPAARRSTATSPSTRPAPGWRNTRR